MEGCAVEYICTTLRHEFFMGPGREAEKTSPAKLLPRRTETDPVMRKQFCELYIYERNEL